jgi:hypothetical protein
MIRHLEAPSRLDADTPQADAAVHCEASHSHSACGARPPRLGRTLLALFASQLLVLGQLTPEFELPPLLYSTTTVTNSVTRLENQLTSIPPGRHHTDWLRHTLHTLDVPAESQVLVFSKTSLQRRIIHPGNPRAIYFSDDAYVGWVPGGLMEIAVSDPAIGIAFYRLEHTLNRDSARITRDPECLSCHAGPLTGQWPGLMIRSVFPDRRGEPFTAAGSFLISHDSPFTNRWGGWYVTGQHGNARHLGNTFAQSSNGIVTLDRDHGANQSDLSSFFTTERYPVPDSDLVALMILEHQVEMHNRLIRATLRTRRWLHYQENLRKELGQPPLAEPSGSAKVVIDAESARILEYLLFCDEITLPTPGIKGNSAFPAAFTRNRIPDAQNRSLKDLDLQTRLFTHRCSYMIYSQAFDNLPTPLTTSIYRQLRQILESDVPPPRFAHLTQPERLAIRDILLATKPGYSTSP